jgi:hypothetical protein
MTIRINDDLNPTVGVSDSKTNWIEFISRSLRACSLDEYDVESVCLDNGKVFEILNLK